MTTSPRLKVWMLQLVPQLWEKGQALLEQNGCHVQLGRGPRDPGYTESELIAQGQDVDAILCSGERLPASILQQLPKLKVIVKAGVGVDNIDLQTATDLGILVANVPVPSDYIGVAEGTVARILALAKRLTHCDQSVKTGAWHHNFDALKGLYLRGGKTIGLLGLGRIAAHVAQLLRPWDVTIIAHDPYVSPEKAELLHVTLVSFDQLLQNSDILSIHTPATPETQHLINATTLRQMKPTAYLINTARGAIVDEHALSQALSQGWIAGAALDVFETEPPDNSPILASEIADHLILSPHVAALSDEMLDDLMITQINFCLQALRGTPPPSTVNPQVVELWQTRVTT
jgi:D-3-phosphoglycerate dehydrogenase